MTQRYFHIRQHLNTKNSSFFFSKKNRAWIRQLLMFLDEKN